MEQGLNDTAQVSNEEYTSPSVISIRLDTAPVLNQIETYLKGTQVIQDGTNEDGEVIFREVIMAPPKANKKGIYDIMGFLKSKVNSQVVQGFFAADQKGVSRDYIRYMNDVHESFADMVIENTEQWDVRDEDLGGIIDTVIHLIRPFMSRLIGDRERGSYANTLKMTESNTVKEQGGFSLFRSHKR